MPHAFRRMPADWLLALAAVRRALVPAADPGRSCLGSLRLAPGHANWDSNAVLYRTWQIPGSSTRVCTLSDARARQIWPEGLLVFPPLCRGFCHYPAAASGPWDARKRNGRGQCVRKSSAVLLSCEPCSRSGRTFRPAPASHPRCSGHASVTRQRYRNRRGPMIRFTRYSPIHCSPDRREWGDAA